MSGESMLSQFIGPDDEQANLMQEEQEEQETDENSEERPEEGPGKKVEKDDGPEEGEKSKGEPEEEDSNDDEGEDTSAKDFWNAVKEKGGYDTDFEFEEDIDPLSPEAIVKALEKERKDTRNGITRHLKENFPVTWKTFEAEQKGIDPFKAFRNMQEEPDFLETEINEDDYEAHEKVIRHFLKDKGLTDKQIARNIKAIKEDDSTFEEAQFAQKELKKVADQKKQEELKAAEQRAREIEENDRRLTRSISDRIEKGKLGDFKLVSEKDKKALMQYVGEKIRRDPDGKSYTVSLDLDENSMEGVLQAMLFLSKGGDLSKYVDQKADTKAARLRLKTVKKGTDGMRARDVHMSSGGLSNFT